VSDLYWQVVNEQPVPPSCPHCRAVMTLVRTIPPVGGLPALFVFHCAGCNHAETKEKADGA